MNQPKFKFGDRVLARSGRDFKITQIQFLSLNSDGPGEFKYNGWFWESEMALYQEPKKKKLYAYKHDLEGGICFFDREDKLEYGNWKRLNDYDLEYPEAE